MAKQHKVIACFNKVSPKGQCLIMMSYRGQYSPAIKAMLKVAVREGLSLEPMVASDFKQDPKKPFLWDRIRFEIRNSMACCADITYESINVGMEVNDAINAGKPLLITLHPYWREEHLKKLCINGESLSIIPADLLGRLIITYYNSDELINKFKKFASPTAPTDWIIG